MQTCTLPDCQDAGQLFSIAPSIDVQIALLLVAGAIAAAHFVFWRARRRAPGKTWTLWLATALWLVAVVARPDGFFAATAAHAVVLAVLAARAMTPAVGRRGATTRASLAGGAMLVSAGVAWFLVHAPR